MLARVVRNGLLILLPAFMVMLVPSSDAQAQLRARGDGAGQQAGNQRGREALEKELERRLALIARDQLRLTDAQFGKLQEVNARFSDRRTELMLRERSARIALRRELRPEGQPDDAEIERLLATLVASQQERAALLEEEQQALAAFLTPVQRARYLGLQEGFRRQVEARRQGMGEARSPRRWPPDNDDGR